MNKQGKVSLDKLFEPFAIKSMKLKNRIVMAPMGTQYCDERGLITQRGLDFYEERAKGGAGLLIFESTMVDRASRSRHESATIDRDESIPYFKAVVDVIHKHDAKVAIQLSHLGSFSAPAGSHMLRCSTTGKAGATLWVSAGCWR